MNRSRSACIIIGTTAEYSSVFTHPCTGRKDTPAGLPLMDDGRKKDVIPERIDPQGIAGFILPVVKKIIGRMTGFPVSLA